MRVLVLQNKAGSAIGYLAEPAAKHGFELKTVLPGRGDKLPPDHESFAGLIVLGGDAHAEDDENHPHLKGEASLIRNFHRFRKPVLGICLGAQLTARALGAAVHRDRCPEIGFVLVRPTPEAADDPLLGNVPEEIRLIHWHADSFDLPEKAVPLLTNDTCPNQAFRAGKFTYAFQAHIEVAPEVMKRWLGMEAEFIAKNYPGFPERFAKDAETHGEAARAIGVGLGDAWFALARRQALRQAFDAASGLDYY